MKETLKAAVKEAMKARDRVKLDTLRALLTAIQYEEIRKGQPALKPEETLAILQNEVKKRRETIELARQGGRDEAIAPLQAEIAVLEHYLPEQLSAAQLEEIFREMKAANPALNLGSAMKQLKEAYAGQFDGKIASDCARRVL